MSLPRRHFIRFAALLLISFLSLQLFFLSRILLMKVMDPRSTSFERSEAWRLREGPLPWQQSWLAYDQMSNQLKRAVVASEDAGFADHSGIEWDAIERAWERNQLAQNQIDQMNQKKPAGFRGRLLEVNPIGGSTITQQLAKNLFLDAERSLARKGQEFLIALMLESVLSKQRMLEIYLNHVEWGEGLFGAQAAALHYFRTPASQLNALQAARLAVMLPAPKRFQRRLNLPYLSRQAGIVLARMPAVEPP